MSKRKVILFGSSYMAEEYLKVLQAIGAETLVIGRQEEKARKLADKYGANGVGGGITVLNDVKADDVDLVVVASAIESLKEVASACLRKGHKNILIEKPGALNLAELVELKQQAANGVELHVAYNRRFYNSVRKLKELIVNDGGALGCFFDFTDREKDIMGTKKSKEVVKQWGLANSTHVIDLAFYLIGLPIELNSSQAGHWDCHPAGNIFVGSGKSGKCLFSYFSTWSGGGRWNVEVSTCRGRYKLSPLEELAFCQKNQFGWQTLDLQDDDDQKYKPGLFKMVKRVLIDKDYGVLPDLEQQIKMGKLVNRIFGYDS